MKLILTPIFDSKNQNKTTCDKIDSFYRVIFNASNCGEGVGVRQEE